MGDGVNRRAVSGEEGFSLVETLLTLLIAGLLAAVLLSLSHQGKRVAVGAAHLSEAAALSNSLLSLILSGAEQDRSGVVHQEGREYQWRADILRLPGERLESVDLRVEWMEERGVRGMTLSALRALRGSGEREASSPAESETETSAPAEEESEPPSSTP